MKNAFQKNLFMLRGFTIIALSSLLLACVSAKEIEFPDGGSGYLIECSKRAQSWSACYDVAEKRCGEDNYEVISAQTNTQSNVLLNTDAIFRGKVNLSTGSKNKRSLVVRCQP